jgi:hypothetical protein
MTLQQLILSMHAVSIPHDLHVSLTRAHVSAEIEAAARSAVERLTLNPNYLMGRTFPGRGPRFPWRAREVQMWRLDLAEPLWLGADGVIYLGHDVDRWGDEEFPHYLLPLEFEQLGLPTLKEVFGATQSLART